MAIIDFNSISGINSITAQSNALNFFTATGSTLSIGASVSGNITGNVTGNLTGNVNASGVSTFSSGIIVAAGSTSAPSISPSGDSNTGIFFPSPDTVAIGEGGVEVLRVDSSGNLGIGTNNPGYQTDLWGNTNTAFGSRIYNFNSGSSASTILQIGNNTNINSAFLQLNSGSNTAAVGGANAFVLGHGLNSPVVISTNGLERWKVDGSGRITTPYQPAFFARPPNSYDIVGGGNIISGTWSETYDRSNSFSNGTFTAPVSGWYCLSWNVFLASEGVRQDAYILVNGAEIMREEISGYTGTANRSVSVHGSIQLAANDAVTYGVYSAAGVTLYSPQNPWGYACGFLVG